MIHSKAIDVLKTFAKEELKQFSDFVRSPFYNKNKNLIKLFDVLKKYHPVFDVENEKLYSKVCPEKSYNHDNMKKLMSEMMDILELFLSEVRFRKGNFFVHKYLLDEYDSRNLDSLFFLKLRNIEENINKGNLNKVNFFEKHSLERSKIFFYYNRESFQKSVVHIIKANELILCHLLEDCFYDYEQLLAAKENYNLDLDIFITEEFFKNIDLTNFLFMLSESKTENSFIYLIANLILLCTNENEIYFTNAKNLFFKSYKELWNILSEERLFFYFATLKNYCTRKHKEGIDKFTIELFELYKFELDHMITSYTGQYYMAFMEFRNIVTIGLQLKKIEWTEKFILKYIKFVGLEEQENIHNESKALLEFCKKNYEMSLEYLSKILFTDISYKSGLRMLTIYNFYELNLFEEAISGVDSLKHYLSSSHKLTKYWEEKLRNSINNFNSLLKMKMTPLKMNNIDLLKLKSEIKNTYNIYQRNWYFEKIEELEKLILSKPKAKSA